MALPGDLERFALFIKSNMISCIIYLIDLNSIKSKYIWLLLKPEPGPWTLDLDPDAGPWTWARTLDPGPGP